MSTITKIEELDLAGTKKGKIVISNVTEPYGANTADIVSIAIALNGEDVQWKAHIPYENIDGLIEALNSITSKTDNIEYLLCHTNKRIEHRQHTINNRSKNMIL